MVGVNGVGADADLLSFKVLRIAKWDDVFERAESRKLKILTWVSIPVKFSSHGYQSMLDEFGDDAASIYGAWCALVVVAASCTVRGTLANGRGNPLPISHISRMTGFPQSLFERLISWCLRVDIGWIEIVNDQNQQTPEKTPEIRGPDESPRNPPETSQASGEIPRLHDKTQQDTTRHNTTGQDKTGSVSAGGCELVIDLLGVDQEVVKQKAGGLSKAMGIFRSDSEFPRVNELCFAAMAINRRSIISDVATSLRSGNIKKPLAYFEGALRKVCERGGLDFEKLMAQVPKFRSSAAAVPGGK